MIILIIITAIACRQKSAKEEPVTIKGIYTKEDSFPGEYGKNVFQSLAQTGE